MSFAGLIARGLDVDIALFVLPCWRYRKRIIVGAAGVDGLVDSVDLSWVNVITLAVKGGDRDHPAPMGDVQTVGLAQLGEWEFAILGGESFLTRPREKVP